MEYYYLLLKNLLQREEGQDATEYVLLLVFIALVIILAVAFLGTTVSSIFSRAGSILS